MVHIRVWGKQLGKKKESLKEQTIELSGLMPGLVSVQEFLEQLVQQQVNASNHKHQQPEWAKWFGNMTEKEGAVTFGFIYNTTEASTEKAVQVVMQAFEDGLFALFYEDHQLEALTDTFELAENDRFTFVKLTFLSGRLW